MRLTPARLAAPLALLLLAGCGSSSTSSSAASSASSSSSSSAATTSDAICASFNTQINALPGAPTTDPAAISNPADLAPIGTYLDSVGPLAVQEQTALTAAPDSSPINASFGAVITKLAAVDNAAKAADLPTFKTAWADFNTANTAFHAAATAAGMSNCAK